MIKLLLLLSIFFVSTLLSNQIEFKELIKTNENLVIEKLIINETCCKKPKPKKKVKKKRKKRVIKKPFCLAPPPTTDLCKLRCAPTKEELKMAEVAWKYIENNYNKKSGLVNSANKFTSGATWDWAGAVYGMYTAYKFGIIDRKKFDEMFSKFVEALQKMPLFNNELPNKTYNTKLLKMSDYRNKSTPDGIGWSALDLGRLMSSLKMIKNCMPEYSEGIDKSLLRWNFCNLFNEEGTMFGAMRRKGKKLVVQEGLTGYEEYSAKAFNLWEFNTDKAKRYDDIEFVEIYGIKIPIDKRKNFHNYVVSESYWLQGMEYDYGDKETEIYARRIHDVQRERYRESGVLTAISEDNIDRKPYFLYNTIYVNGETFKTITDKAEDYDMYKSLSTKAGLGMYYIFNTPYSKRVFNALRYAYDENKGWYSGKYEKIGGMNKALTLNTNGIILETLLYGKMGPLHKQGRDEFSYWDFYKDNVNNFRCLPTDRIFTILEPNYPDKNTTLSLKDIEKAKIAWRYFEVNYNKNSGFVNGNFKFPQVKVKDIANTIFGTISAQKLNIITLENFNDRVSTLLNTLKNIKLYNNELPNTVYNAKNGDMVSFSNKLSKKGVGFVINDIAKLLTAFYTLEQNYPNYKDDIYHIVSRFVFRRATKDKKAYSIFFNGKKEFINREIKPAYEFYIRNALRFYNIKIESDLIGEVSLDYKPINNYEVVMGFKSKVANAEPYLWTMLEQPYFLKYKHYISNIFLAQKAQYKKIKKLITSSEEAIDKKPNYIFDNIYDSGKLFPTIGKDKKPYQKLRNASIKSAFIYEALYDDIYSKFLRDSLDGNFSKNRGFYNGVYIDKNRKNSKIDLTTNTAVLEALLYKKIGNFYYHHKPKELKKLKNINKNIKGKVYSIQIASSKKLDDMKRVFKKIKSHSDVRIEKKGEYFVLRVGIFNNKNSAKDLYKKLKKSFKTAILKKVDIDSDKFIHSNSKLTSISYKYPHKNIVKIAYNREFAKYKKSFDKKEKLRKLEEEKKRKALEAKRKKEEAEKKRLEDLKKKEEEAKKKN